MRFRFVDGPLQLGYHLVLGRMSQGAPDSVNMGPVELGFNGLASTAPLLGAMQAIRAGEVGTRQHPTPLEPGVQTALQRG